MYNKRILIMLIIILLIITFAFLGHQFKEKNTIKYDSKLPDNITFINANNSPNFVYNTDIIINGMKQNNDYTSFQCNIKITPKTNHIYNNVHATAFLDQSIIKYFAVNAMQYFGTDESEKITIDSKNKESKGLIINKTTWLFNNKYNENEFKMPVKVKVSWNNGIEYIIIQPNEINITIK